MGSSMDRRAFLGGALAAGVTAAAAGLVACAPESSSALTESSSTGSQTGSPAVDWLGSAPEISDSDCVETVDVEVLVAGAGNAGYFSANFAAQEGAKVLLIEKNQVGCGIRDSALAAIGSRYQKERGIEIDKAEILNDLASYATGEVNTVLHRLWADNSGEAIDWYIDLASEDTEITIDLEWSMPAEKTRFNCWPVAHGTNDGSDLFGGIQTAVVSTMMELLDERLIANGGAIRYNTPLISLIKEEDRVVGVYAKNENEEYIRINASKGVIVSTGGYVNNAEMYDALQGQLKKSVSGWCCHAMKPATGDGIKACLWAGARFDAVKTSMIFDRGLVSPQQDFSGPESGGYYFTLGSQPFLKVNQHGKRFYNESTPYDYIIHAANQYENNAWYMIWDNNWEENVVRFHTTGCSTIDLHEGGDQQSMGLEATAAEMADLVDQSLLAKADTLEELASQFGFDDVQTFLDTVERHNELFDKQKDEDFGKEPFRLSELRNPPYYGAKLGGLALCTLDGIAINEQFQALDENNKPIEGLYVLGNDSGSYYSNTYPNLVVGANAGRCVTHGMLCGKALAQQ